MVCEVTYAFEDGQRAREALARIGGEEEEK
jgi:hypothetical protein